jgi:hypothetical protein
MSARACSIPETGMPRSDLRSSSRTATRWGQRRVTRLEDSARQANAAQPDACSVGAVDHLEERRADERIAPRLRQRRSQGRRRHGKAPRPVLRGGGPIARRRQRLCERRVGAGCREVARGPRRPGRPRSLREGLPPSLLQSPARRRGGRQRARTSRRRLPRGLHAASGRLGGSCRVVRRRTTRVTPTWPGCYAASSSASSEIPSSAVRERNRRGIANAATAPSPTTAAPTYTAVVIPFTNVSGVL